jgi:G3E family GTPase
MCTYVCVTLTLVLANRAGHKVALLVNDMAEVNVDAMLLREAQNASGGEVVSVLREVRNLNCFSKQDKITAYRDLILVNKLGH